MGHDGGGARRGAEALRAWAAVAAAAECGRAGCAHPLARRQSRPRAGATAGTIATSLPSSSSLLENDINLSEDRTSFLFDLLLGDAENVGVALGAILGDRLCVGVSIFDSTFPRRPVGDSFTNEDVDLISFRFLSSSSSSSSFT